MTGNIKIVERASQKILMIRSNVCVFFMPRVMGESYGRILALLEENKIIPAGPPVCRYTGFDWNRLARESRLTTLFKTNTRRWNIEMGVPVNVEVSPGENMEISSLEGGTYLQTMHRGSYGRVGKTYRKMMEYMFRESIGPVNESVEIYINDPRTTPAAELETLVLIPLDPLSAG